MKYKKTIFTLIVLIILAIVAFWAWKTAYAPAIEEPVTQTPNPTPTPVPISDPTPTPTPVPAATTGTLMGHADLGASKITKILVYNSTGKVLISSVNLDASGNYTLELAPGDYKIDFAASPDLYPHSPEPFTIKAGQIHEFDFNIET